MRRRLAQQGFGADHGFRWRGGETSRLEGPSDAVFAFAVCFAILFWVWYDHYRIMGRSMARHATWHPHDMALLRTAVTAELTPGELAALRGMVFEAFGGRFDEHDWEHTLGGVHVLVVEDGEPVAHGAVVGRVLVAEGRELRTGYVEGVATRADRRGAGLATAVMRAVGRVIRDGYELGALADGTRIPGFYQRLGWETWRGPTFVAGPEGPVRTAEDDGGILVLRTPATAGLEPTGPLVCDWRAGDVW